MKRALGLALVAVVAAGICGCDTTPAASDAPEWCDQAPVLTWDNFGAGFLLENCQPCHASGADDRHDAPRTVAFDSLERVVILRGAILDQATGPEPPMPPAGGVSDSDRALLEAWLECGSDVREVQ